MLIAALVTPAPAAPRAGIAVAITESAAGWNAGDLDRFMAVYADDATYVTKRGIVRGRAAIASRYGASFAKGANTRGRLFFRLLGDRRIDATHHILFARWMLARGAKTESGMTTLVFERRGTAWLIVADHSS